MWGGGWGFWWLFPLLMMFIIAFCIGGFFFGHRWGARHRHRGPPWHMSYRHPGLGRPYEDATYSALQILNERFAKGEIQKQEYEEKKAVIRSSA
jgi:putative membrane protein